MQDDAAGTFGTHPAQVEKIYLKPGEVCFSQRPVRVTTILGSCVAVTMFHRPSGVAAICHALQPVCPLQPAGCRDRCPKKYQYVSCVVPIMAARMMETGYRAREIEAKVFGGAALFRSNPALPSQLTIGRQNVETAMALMCHSGFMVKASHVGGDEGRKIIFDTRTGDVLLKGVGRGFARQLMTEAQTVIEGR